MAQTLDHCYVKTIKFTLSSLGHLHSTVVTSGYFCFHPLAMVLVYLSCSTTTTISTVTESSQLLLNSAVQNR